MKNWLGSVKGSRIPRATVAIGVFTATALMGVTMPGAPIANAAVPEDAIQSIKPVRYVDTRAGELTVDGEYAGTGRLKAGTVFAVDIAGRPRVPADAAAVMMNVTAVRPDGPGHVTVFPCGTTPPTVSSINYRGNDVAPNAVLSKIGANGQICVVSLRDTDLLIDINAFVPAGGSPTSIAPVRRVDTRTAPVGGTADNPGRLKGGQEYKITIAGKSGVPADASAAMMNVTAVRPDGPGHITVYPCGRERPIVSSLNYQGDDVVPNAVLAKLGTGGQVCVYSLSGADLLIDINGYVPDGGLPRPVDPARLADTRPGEKTADGKEAGTGRLKGGEERAFTISGRANLNPLTAAMLNITVVRPDGPGHITVYPCNTRRPNVSSINYAGGDVVANAVYTAVGGESALCVYSVSDTDLIIDINAAMPSPIDGGAQPPPPQPTVCTIAGAEVETTIPQAECDALVALYNATGGPQWKDHEDWNTATDPCEWRGVECEYGHVDILSLPDNNLTGALPPEIGDLAGLTRLLLKGNSLSGSIPTTVGKLGKVWKIDLSANLLSGPIPTELGDARDMAVLQLANNELSGPIPTSIGNLTDMVYLDVAYNKLSGPIPTSMGNLSELDTLWLDNNSLTGSIPTLFGNLDQLTTFTAVGNKLSGPIPATIGNMSGLLYFDLSDNQLTGPIPNKIGNFTVLEHLDLGGNKLTGAIPSGIGDLRKADWLNLGENELSGAVPTSMVNLGDPKFVGLSGNGCLSATDPTLVAWLNREDPGWNGGC